MVNVGEKKNTTGKGGNEDELGMQLDHDALHLGPDTSARRGILHTSARTFCQHICDIEISEVDVQRVDPYQASPRGIGT